MPEFGIENGIFATLPLQIGTGVNPGINYLFYFNQYCNVITSQTITVFCLHTSFISYFNFLNLATYLLLKSLSNFLNLAKYGDTSCGVFK